MVGIALLAAFGVLSLAALSRRLRPAVDGVVAGLFWIALTPLTELGKLVAGVREWLRAQAAGVTSRLGESGGAWRVIGAFLTFALLAVFVAAEYHVLATTFAVMGWGRILGPPLAVSVVAADVLFAAAILDVAGVTNLAPWGDLRGRARWVAAGVLGACLALFLAFQAAVGVWRAPQLVSAGALPEDLRRAAGLRELLGDGQGTGAQTFISVVLPVLLSLAAMFSGWAVAYCLAVLWLVALTLATAAVVLLQLPLGVANQIGTLAHQVVEGWLNLVTGAGDLVLRRRVDEADEGLAGLDREPPPIDDGPAPEPVTVGAPYQAEPAGPPEDDHRVDPVDANWTGPFGERSP